MSDIRCPQCQNPIYDEDVLSCHFCGGSLKRQSGGVLGGMRSGVMKWVGLAIVFLMAAALIISMF